jgi:ubiquitin-protein ligase
MSKKSSNISIRAISKQLELILKEENEHILSVIPDEKNIYEWEIVIIGPNDSPYEGGIFKLKILFTEEYPYKAPKINFKTNIYHPNIAITDGQICVDMLQDKWSPANTINSIVLSIISLLNDPNPDSPLNAEAGELYLKNKKEYYKKIRKFMIEKKAY